MSSCLDEIAVRAAADGEASAATLAHLETCGSCRERVRAATAASAQLARMAAAIPVPEGLDARVARAAGGRPASRGGATTLRSGPGREWLRPAWISGVALGAAVLAFVFFLPVPHAPPALSAAEILGRSLDSWTPDRGTELFEFDLTVDLPSVSAIPDGTYRIEQLVDHDAPGRSRVSRYAPDGSLVVAMSDHAASRARKVLLRHDGRSFLFTFETGPRRGVDPGLVERTHVEAMIRLLQSMAGQTVTEHQDAGGLKYVVELPPVTSPGSASPWQLVHARVVVDGDSFELLEAEASGSYLNEPFAIAFRLRQRAVRPTATVPAAEFDVPDDPAAISIEATGSDNLGHDLFTAALRELARQR